MQTGHPHARLLINLEQISGQGKRAGRITYMNTSVYPR